MSKMKVVKQHDLKDCGVCSLASIIEYYGGYVPIERLRLDTHTNELGTNALSLIETGKKYGFDSTGVKVDSLFDDSFKLPAIAHVTTKNGLDHFVVIYKITQNNVQIMDPAKGKVIMSINEFNEIWNNVLLMFYPKRPIIFLPKENSLWQVFMKIYQKEKKLFSVILVTSILLMLFTIASSYYFKIAIESINLNKDPVYLKVIVFVFAFVLIFKLIFNSIRRRLENHLNKNIDVLLLSDFIKHIFHLPLEVITSRSSGEVITRINELANIKGLFTEIAISCVLDLSLMLTSIPILYSISHNLFFILLFLIMLYLIIGLISSKIIYKKAYGNIELESIFNSSLIEKLNMITSIKNLNLTKNFLGKIEHDLSRFLYDSFKLENFVTTEENLKHWVNEVGLFLINTFGFFLIFKEKLSITELITFNTLVVYFLDPIKNVINALPKYNFVKASFSKLNEFLSVSEETYGKKEEITKNDICIRNLEYSYDHYNKILDNVSLTINQDSLVLLKGHSGCGKSTICRILEKYITNYKGEILIGGIDLKDYSVATIRGAITYVSQKESLITGTIKENILLDRKVSLERFNEICKICRIDKIVDKRPLRYETLISNESSFISGGEKQRIILARALLQNASVYLIDEALSEVDYETENNIILDVRKNFKDKTILYITHKELDKDLFDKVINLEEKHEL